MPAVVVDCSVLVPFFLPDEDDATFQALIDDEETILTAPILLKTEFANVITIARRRDRITEQEAENLFADLAALPITFDDSHNHSLPDFVRAWKLSDRCHLSFYDALYLDLTLTHAARLATLDSRLRAAAEAQGAAIYATP